MSPNNSIMDNVANVANEGLDTLTDTMSNVGAEIKEKVKEKFGVTAVGLRKTQ